MAVSEFSKNKAFQRVGETDRSYKSKQNNSESKSHQGKRRRNIEQNKDITTRASASRNED